jgi:hypothetical protein
MKRVRIKLAIDEARKARDQQGTGESVMQETEVLARFTHLARHGETERTRLDATSQLARHYGLLSDTLRLQQDQRRKDENDRLGEKIQGRVQQVLAERAEREARGED